MNKKVNQRLGFAALVIAEFFNAFIDNALRMLVLLRVVAQPNAPLVLTFAFVAPFLLLFNPAGFLSDKFNRKTVILGVKLLELVIVVLIGIFFQDQTFFVLASFLFLLGVRSALFAPAKYAILPDLVGAEKLSLANGQVQMWTYIAIVLGQGFGGYFFQEYGYDRLSLLGFLGTASVLGLLAAFLIPSIAAVAPQRRFVWNPLQEMKMNWAAVGADRALFLSVLGIVYFCFLGGVFQLNTYYYFKDLVNPFMTLVLMAALSVGIALGGLLSGKVSDQKIELGLVPLGAFGIAIFSLALGWCREWNTAISLVIGLGVACGFYTVPLNAYIQQISPPERRSSIIAGANFFNFLAILLGSISVIVLRNVWHVSAVQIFIICGFLTLVAVLLAIKYLPFALLRLMVWTLTHTLYKVKILHPEHVPQTGGALLVANHVSFFDPFFVAVSTSRQVRFIQAQDIFEKPLLKPFCRIAGSIPIPRGKKPKEILKALLEARQAIEKGELICIFAEGQLTRTGNTLKFHEGFETIMKGLQAPVIPVHLDRIWGSMFTFKDGKIFFKLPKIIPYPVTITFGQPKPANVTAFDMRQEVVELGSEAFKYRLDDKRTLAEAFLIETWRQPTAFCVADSTGKKLNRAVTFASAVAMSSILKGKVQDQTYVGICLPPSVGAVLVNLALNILNKVPVNINYTASKEALASVINQCGMSVCITSRAFLEKAGLTLTTKVLFIEDLVKEFSAPKMISAFLKTFAGFQVLAHKIIFGQWRPRDNQSLATIMFTSGSTGEPKGVMLSHANIYSNIEGLYQVFQIKEGDTIMGVLPFFHSFGFTGTLWFPLLTGMGAVYHYNPLDAKVIGKLTKEYQATALMATPTFLSSYTRRCEAEDLHSLRCIVVGAEKLKEPIAQAFFDKFGVMPMEGYGCTELSPIVSVNLPDYVGGGIVQKANKFGTIGQPLPGVAARIVDPETNVAVGKSREGLLLVKGPNVMQGYLKAPAKTKEVLVDGWYRTGDIAHIDEDGFITITDRLSRFSKIAGEMVPHIKIEATIHEILQAAETLCAVTSIPDEKKGERLAVLIRQDIDVPGLVAKLKQSGLPNLWIPDEGMFFKVENLPLLGSGKLDLGTIKKKVQELVQNKAVS